MEPIYLDHAATTPMSNEVIEAMLPVYKETFGNPSSVHSFGRKARQHLDAARRVMANSIHANEKEIIYTSGGTEADNLALIGTALANRDKGNHIITSAQEHHAVLHTAEYLEKQGFNVTYLPVNKNGKIDVQDLQKALTDETILVSIMYVNNETGIIQPIEEIGELLKDHQAYFHTDAVQAYGLIDINVKTMHIDLLSVSSHKINGPKGIGFLYADDHVKMNPLQFGGEQERKRRAGTENIVSVVGFQKAVELAVEHKAERVETYQQFKQLFLEELTNHGVEFQVNGESQEQIASIVNISFPGANVEQMLTNFDLDGIAASSGSACTAGSVEPSHVLTAMFGENNPCTTNSIRFSFGIFNTTENVKEAAERVAKIINRLI
ncbi:cysteine desulfurase NifS [Oceanobacillus zhaokaii]|uniref:cysteine desulfurase n=1 Tax=Oceanobacillus zhaokaii TaxID=2052660 RepID=A0A345PHS8_9BACI|nr:cysteine desulfurase family protein [Oceanobacillus zhaokaii]AXI09558.1 cysteine desulfurase NifS [Oceanobacillus zhaokaii]